ncbi:hypothetical protein OUZ56_022432 [Daphnia magna]|uniref:Uncharacterized protein n=1 Tax=Daphnia magna TaxID=35525 RepID=A0ABR0AWF5_9CRUS|nr:hypothetical protein OUZ56_022432 [Daphnia magna]
MANPRDEFIQYFYGLPLFLQTHSSCSFLARNARKTGQLSTENVSLQSEVKSQRELIEQLESDVSSLQHLSTLNRGEAESSVGLALHVKICHVSTEKVPFEKIDQMLGRGAGLH